MCWQVSQVETLALSRQIYSYGILSSVAVAVAVAAAARAAAVVVAVAVAGACGGCRGVVWWSVELLTPVLHGSYIPVV